MANGRQEPVGGTHDVQSARHDLQAAREGRSRSERRGAGMRGIDEERDRDR